MVAIAQPTLRAGQLVRRQISSAAWTQLGRVARFGIRHGHERLRVDEEDAGSLSDPSNGASPPCSVFGNEWVRFVRAVPTRVRGEKVVLVGRCATAGCVRTPALKVTL
jgi:hypothetical protein